MVCAWWIWESWIAAKYKNSRAQTIISTGKTYLEDSTQWTIFLLRAFLQRFDIATHRADGLRRPSGNLLMLQVLFKEPIVTTNTVEWVLAYLESCKRDEYEKQETFSSTRRTASYSNKTSREKGNSVSWQVSSLVSTVFSLFLIIAEDSARKKHLACVCVQWLTRSILLNLRINPFRGWMPIDQSSFFASRRGGLQPL